jgi:hypothetical protein
MNREQMVAEAKKWGESWREKRRAAAGSLDSPSGSGDSCQSSKMSSGKGGRSFEFAELLAVHIHE